MGIIGFANEDFDEHITPSLSSIDQQTVQMGREAFSMLLKLIEGKNVKTNSISKIVLEPIPFFRESTLRNVFLNGSDLVSDEKKNITFLKT